MSLTTELYAGEKLETALAGHGQWTLEIAKRSDQVDGFQVLPRRWVVERTFAWFGRNPRLAKDFERTVTSSQAWLYLASVQLLARRLARSRASNRCLELVGTTNAIRGQALSLCVKQNGRVRIFLSTSRIHVVLLNYRFAVQP
jgi:Transposase DDE domain